MNENMLSKRLQTVATYIPKRAYFADIGSDHAYLPCYVCLQDSEARAIAGEVNEGPYQSAKRNVEQSNLSNRIDVRKGNGLKVLAENEVEQVVIAGMGGSLITTILNEGKKKLGAVNRIIAQPNVDAVAVREWFYKNGFDLVDEKILMEDGHIYEVLVADKGNTNQNYQEEDLRKQLLFGPILLKEKSEAFKNKWKTEEERKILALNQMKQAKTPDYEKIEKFTIEIRMIREVIE